MFRTPKERIMMSQLSGQRQLGNDHHAIENGAFPQQRMICGKTREYEVLRVATSCAALFHKNEIAYPFCHREHLMKGLANACSFPGTDRSAVRWKAQISCCSRTRILA